jgi:menaquinone-dependent protoporphyrinogen oxidase
MKVLVSAASKHGSTDEIARAIGEVLAGRGIEATVLRVEDVSTISGYDAFVIGSAVYAGRWRTSAKELILTHASTLASRPVWLFSSGPCGDPPEPQGDPSDVASLAEVTRAIGHRVFSGRLERRRLGLAERTLVRAMKAPEGDYRDWEEIRRWATSIGDVLVRAGASAATSGSP